jgi:transcriptional regulator with XRE-family HTH domain
MDMKVDTGLIRAERERRAWSQEHLASETGLGVRTIQRIEASGLASYGSVTALADALGMSASDLIVVSEPDLIRVAKPTSSEETPPAQSLRSGKQIRRQRLALPSIALACGLLAGSAVAVLVPGELWWIGSLLFALSIVGRGRSPSPARPVERRRTLAAQPSWHSCFSRQPRWWGS